VRKVQWASFPQTKPSGAPDEATAAAWDTNNLKASMGSMKAAFETGGGKLWGKTTAADMDRVQRFMLQSKQIEKILPPSTFLVSDAAFWEAANKFDVDTIKKAAEACPEK
jgi:NitT/TauT family transport system substrate-binding protein